MPAMRGVSPTVSISRFTRSILREFNRIIDYFADEYLTGRTPNPCVVCNSWLKFGHLWSYGQQLQADSLPRDIMPR